MNEQIPDYWQEVAKAEQKQRHPVRTLILISVVSIGIFLLAVLTLVALLPTPSTQPTPVVTAHPIAASTPATLPTINQHPKLYDPLTDFDGKYGAGTQGRWYLDKLHTVYLMVQTGDPLCCTADQEVQPTTQIDITVFPLVTGGKAIQWSTRQQEAALQPYMPLHAYQIPLPFPPVAGSTYTITEWKWGAHEFRMYTTKPTADGYSDMSLQVIS